ncbi:MAG TPA: hypothetical protein VN940_06665 [Candidatus Dormibacteraeota bacterium]|nr:hypothetical protein [Candidatus Dormibacteraeota bacterium]
MPEGPAGVIAIEVAATVPAESLAPLARRHSPVRRSVAVADDMRETVAVVGTVIVWLPLAAVRTVIEMPVAAVTSPLTKAIAGCPDGVGLGEAPGAGFGPNWPAPQPVEAFGDRRTVIAVNAPAESFWPVATTQRPGTMSASTAVDVRVKVVVPLNVTLMSPLAPVRIRVCPLICTSWPAAPLRNWAPPVGVGEADELAAVAALPQAATQTPAAMASTKIMRFI